MRLGLGRSSPADRAGTGLRSARDRFERRAAAARRRPRLVAAIALGLVVVTGLVVWLGWFSSLLTATSVRVEGASKGAVSEVKQVAGVPIGAPIMRVDTAAITRRLVEHHSYSDVVVSRSLPHTIVISVTPRVPVLAVKKPEGQLEVVDQDGFAFRTVTAAPKGVPQVTASSTAVTASGLRAAIRALDALDATMRPLVSGVTVGTADQVTFTLTVKDAKRTVIWGAQGDEAVKSKLVTILTKEPGAIIDVSVPSSPVTR